MSGPEKVAGQGRLGSSNDLSDTPSEFDQSSESDRSADLEVTLLQASDVEEKALTTSTINDDTASSMSDRVNYRSLLPLCFMQFCETWNSDSIYSYVSYLVIDFVPGLTQDEAGLYAGFVAGCYYIGQFMSSFLWGFLSDRYGRKSLLLLGGVGTLLSIIMFGFSRNLAWAIVSRSLCGILNGNLGIAKSLIAEMSNSKTQAQSFGLLGIFWGLGSIVGALVGGVLARPAQKFNVFKGTIFDYFPYLLSNLVSAVVMITGILACAIFLKEPPRKKDPTLDRDASAAGGGASKFAAFRVMKDSQVLLSVCSYVFIGGINTFVKETVPLFFVSTPDVGGLDFGTTETGIFNGCNGLFTCLFQLFLYKRIANKLGMVFTHRMGIIGMAVLNLMLPFSNFLFGVPALMWIFLVIFSAAMSCLVQCAFSAVFVLISNSTTKSNMGLVNGVSQSVVALTRAFGPMIGARLFAYSVDGSRSFPFNVWFNFVIQALLFTSVFCMTMMFSDSLNKPKDELIIQELKGVK